MKPKDATHLENEKPPDHEIEEGEFPVIAAAKANASNPDPTDAFAWSPNRTAGMPQGGWQGIVIHTEEGYHDASVSWLRNPASQASAHWCIRRDGYIVQLVSEADRAWHGKSAGMYMLGIEHEGGSGAGSVPILWKTKQDAAEIAPDDAMLQSSTDLSAYLCVKYNVEPTHPSAWNDRTGPDTIAGHSQLAGNDHVDPYKYFPWKAYMATLKKKIAQRKGSSNPAPAPKPEPKPDGVRPRYGLAGKPRYGEGWVIEFLKGKGADADWLQMVPEYYRLAAVARKMFPEQASRVPAPDAMALQGALETGFGKYGGASRPYNPAGIKHGEAKGDVPGDFEVPFSPTNGALLHILHLGIYTGGPLLGFRHSRYFAAKAARAGKPVAQTYDDLAGTWAADTTYAGKLKKLEDELERG